jgi:hypothetical protein
LSLVEAAIGVLLVFGVVAGFGLVSTEPGVAEARLDRFAADAGAALTVADGDGFVPRVGTAVGSRAALDTARPALRTRLDALFPSNVVYRVRTPVGSLGQPRPAGAAVGRSRVPTPNGTVVVEVWYA